MDHKLMNFDNCRQNRPAHLTVAYSPCRRLTMVTHNTRHFSNIPHIKMEDWLK